MNPTKEADMTILDQLPANSETDFTDAELAAHGLELPERNGLFTGLSRCRAVVAIRYRVFRIRADNQGLRT